MNARVNTETGEIEKPTGLALLRVPFEKNQISKLPKPYRSDSPKGTCKECGGYHGLPALHLDYVGHAALTDRLLDADPTWIWEPVAMGEDGQPKLDSNGGMWIRLTVCGVTRLGYGDAQGKTGGNAVKELIGDALRNAAMRFGAALDLWHKGDLHNDGDDAIALAERKAAGLPTSTITPTDGALEALTSEQRARVEKTASSVIDCFTEGREDAVDTACRIIEDAEFDADCKVALWTFFDSKQRSAMKKKGEERKKAKLKELEPTQA